jgi:hypothetical protein
MARRSDGIDSRVDGSRMSLRGDAARASRQVTPTGPDPVLVGAGGTALFTSAEVPERQREPEAIGRP